MTTTNGQRIYWITLFAVIAAAVTFVVQATPVSAKLCGVGVDHPAVSVPIAGQELTISYYLTDPETGDMTDDPDCAIGADAEGEIETGVRAFLGDLEGSSFSADLEKVDPWRYQTTLTFPEPGNWELFFNFSYMRPATARERSLSYVGPVNRLQRVQYRWKVDVAGSASGMPSAGSGGAAGVGGADLVDGAAFPLAYALAAGGAAALAASAVVRMGRKPK